MAYESVPAAPGGGGGEGGGATDHGALTGLGDNDHPQYSSLTSSGLLTHTATTGNARRLLFTGAGATVDDTVANVRTVDIPGGGGGGVTDHGALTGLADDDHPQYALLANAGLLTHGVTTGNGRRLIITGAGAVVDDTVANVRTVTIAGGGGGFTPGGANRIPFANSGGTALTDLAGFTLASNVLTHTASSNAGTVKLLLENSHNASTSSHAVFEVKTGGASAGDPEIDLTVTGAYKWRIKANNTGTRDYLTIGFDSGATVDAHCITVVPQVSDIAGCLMGINVPSGTAVSGTLNIYERAGDNGVNIVLRTQSGNTACALSYQLRNSASQIAYLLMQGSAASVGVTSVGGETTAGRFGLVDEPSAASSGLFLATMTNTSLKLITNNVIRVALDGAGNVALGAGLTTTSADGDVYIPSCAGIPTTAPTGKTNLLALRGDRTNNKLYLYSGGAWQLVGP